MILDAEGGWARPPWHCTGPMRAEPDTGELVPVHDQLLRTRTYVCDECGVSVYVPLLGMLVAPPAEPERVEVIEDDGEY